jgi:hypothetical protein
MGTVRDYFEIDFPHVMRFESGIEVDLVMAPDEQVVCEFKFRTHLDFNANAIFYSAYVDHSQHAADLAASFVTHTYDIVANTPEGISSSGLATDPLIQARDLRFAGRVFLYIDAEIPDSHAERLVTLGRELGIAAVVRGRRYASARTAEERPAAFISYDSRDRDDIARPLAQRLSAYGCPVWFDEFSLRVGDSLRESIERGMRDCQKCVLIVSPRFVANAGWTKTEFNAIFTREIHERNHLILPVWAGVTPEDVYNYSPTLADRYAISWDRGLEDVVLGIRKAIGC